MNETNFTIPAKLEDSTFAFDVSGLSTGALLCLLVDVAAQIAERDNTTPVAVLQMAIAAAPESLV